MSEMSKRRSRNVTMLFCFFLTGSLLLVGCSMAPKVRVHGYIEEKERVDLEQNGNAGYLYGRPKPEDLKPADPTRKVFVVEVSQDPSPLPDKYYMIDREESTTETVYPPAASSKVQTMPENEPGIVLPSFSDEDFEVDEPSAKMVKYTVEKNDTLQKISKKFYGSFSKWPKIYEANKDKLKTPDFIKPGIEIRIPME